MKRIRNISVVLVLLCMLNHTAFAQVAKTIIVEHFTNTRCSVCASRNPGFYSNLAQHPGILHVAFHPSSPYSNCFLNNQNKEENDERTRYYGVYGVTPRFIILGETVASWDDYASPALFDPYEGQTSPLQLAITLSAQGTDSVKAVMIVKTVAPHTLGDLLLFAAAAEEELQYAAPNGEQLHHDVFRKSFFETSGRPFRAPATVGDSVVLTGVLRIKGEWDPAQLYSLCIISEAGGKKVVQAARSAVLGSFTGQDEPALPLANIYPVPAAGQLTVSLKKGTDAMVSVFNLRGLLISRHYIGSQGTIGLDGVIPGLYIVQVESSEGVMHQKICVGGTN